MSVIFRDLFSFFRAFFGSLDHQKIAHGVNFPPWDVRDFWTASASSSTAWAAHGTRSSRNFASWKIPRRSCRRSDGFFLLGAIGAVAELDFVQRLEIFQYLSVRGCTWPCVPGICKSFCRFPKGLGDVVIFG